MEGEEGNQVYTWLWVKMNLLSSTLVDMPLYLKNYLLQRMFSYSLFYYILPLLLHLFLFITITITIILRYFLFIYISFNRFWSLIYIYLRANEVEQIIQLHKTVPTSEFIDTTCISEGQIFVEGKQIIEVAKSDTIGTVKSKLFGMISQIY